MKRLLLIDADILAYKAAALNEQTVDFGEGGVARVLNPEQVIPDLQDAIAFLMDRLKASAFHICLTDPNREWRKKFDPTYKAHRDPSKKPELLKAVKAWLHEEYASTVIPWLEADDVMGIMATRPQKLGWQSIIVSEDKDMRTIPARVYHPHRDELGVMRISKLEANRFLMWQTLVGDSSDGYPGCPGIGPSSPYVEDLMTLTTPAQLWDCVIDAYASKGLKEADAVHQARLACICRAANWDSKTGQVRLWNPTHLSH